MNDFEWMMWLILLAPGIAAIPWAVEEWRGRKDKIG